jgi:CheY-like chemotaxis protein
MDVAKFHILVLDDYVDAADSTVELLSIWGYDAIACYNGAAALKSACLHRPDLVVLELAMPHMDGFQFTGLFHEMSDCVSVPLIAMSGNSTQAYRARAWEAGVRHYLLKPTCLKSLKDLLASEIEQCNVSRQHVKDMCSDTNADLELLSGLIAASGAARLAK